MDDSSLPRSRGGVSQGRFESAIPVQSAVDSLPATILGLGMDIGPGNEGLLLGGGVTLAPELAPANALLSFVDVFQELGEGSVRKLQSGKKQQTIIK